MEKIVILFSVRKIRYSNVYQKKIAWKNKLNKLYTILIFVIFIAGIKFKEITDLVCVMAHAITFNPNQYPLTFFQALVLHTEKAT